MNEGTFHFTGDTAQAKTHSGIKEWLTSGRVPVEYHKNSEDRASAGGRGETEEEAFEIETRETHSIQNLAIKVKKVLRQFNLF